MSWLRYQGAAPASDAAGATITADASITLGAVTISATATRGSVADASITLGAITISSDATRGSIASAAITLGAVTISADGTVTGGIVASADITLGAVTISATATRGSVASAAITLGAVTLSGAYTVTPGAGGVVTASAAITLLPVRSYSYALIGDDPMSIREAALEAIAVRLAAYLAPTPVERGRRSDIASGDCPRIVVRMGSHDEEDTDFGVITLRCEAMVEGYAAAPRGAIDPDAEVEAALNLLHARCAAALLGNELVISPTDTMQVTGQRVDMDVPPLAAASEGVGGFIWTVGFQLRAPATGGFYTS